MIETDSVSLFNLQDLFLVPLLLILFYFIYRRSVLKKFKESPVLFRIFLFAFLFKFFCTFMNSAITQFYYDKVGDTFKYYTDILNIRAQLAGNTHASLWDFYFHNQKFSESTGMAVQGFGETSTGNVSLLMLPFAYIFFNSYLCIAMTAAFLALLGCCKIYEVFADVFPEYKVQAAIASVLLPGVCFWSSTLLKDPFSLAGMGYALWYFRNIFIKGKLGIRNIIGLAVSLAMIYSFKPYILIIVISFVSWAILCWLKKIRSYFLKFMAVLLLLVGAVAGFRVAMDQLNEVNTGPLADFKTEQISDQLEHFEKSYKNTSDDGSYFSLGNIDYSNPLSVAGAIPQALTAVYFRPFIWEAGKPIMLLSALESFFLFYLFIFTMIKSRIFGFFKIIFTNRFLFSFFIFCVFFGAAVTIAAPNFGTLARYKIPCMPFMVFILLVIKQKLKKKSSVPVDIKPATQIAFIPTRPAS